MIYQVKYFCIDALESTRLNTMLIVDPLQTIKCIGMWLDANWSINTYILLNVYFVISRNNKNTMQIIK